jgi:ferritin-like metal-binding protein YciE
MSLDTLDDTLLHAMSDLLSAEKQFSRALTKVAKAADSDAVRQLAQQHYEETQQQIENLQQAFSALGKKPERMLCHGAQGICEENDSTLKEEKPKGDIKDIALVSGCLRVEHYEIAGYTAAIALSKALGQRQVTQLLQANLKQEQAAAKKLEATGSTILQGAGAESKAQASGAGTGAGGAKSSATGGRGRRKASTAAASGGSATGKRRGRPPGSKNKSRTTRRTRKRQ